MDPSFRDQARADIRRAVGAGLVGAGTVGLTEFALGVKSAQGHVKLVTALRFLTLDATLVSLFAILVIPVIALFFLGARGLYATFDRDAARAWHGVGARPGGRAAGPDPAVPWLWAGGIAVLAYVTASYLLTLKFLKRFKDPHSIALTLAEIQVVLVVVLAVVAVLIGFGLRRVARRAHDKLGPFSPVGHPGAAIGLVAILALPLLWFVQQKPALRAAVPWGDPERARLFIAIGMFLAGAVAGARLVARRGSLFPRDPRKKRIALAAAAAAFLLVAPPTLLWVGANPEAKYLAISASPPLGKLVGFVRWANDFDRDGYGSLLGENDCKPFDKKIHPGARDIPDNGIDENCNGRDFSAKGIASWKKGEKMPVPDEWKRGDWNFLLITIDTVRYDHTTFGGYKAKKGRDTTPRLAELAARGVSFDFCNAPSAGTMASVPAIIMSKFFHSGIALGPERRPMPPKLLPENTTMGEMMKRAGYKTGAIVSHEYFNDWGIDQGFDSYDNEIGAKPNPMGTSSEVSTDKAEAWISKAGDKKWFLWVHYIDPHGRYVAHPGHRSFGDPSVEEDLYDGELAYTDEYIGKLLDFVAHSPNASRTIIVVTSDHGDGFMEHGFINHGQKLYWELLHVPLVFYVPDAEPHTVDGPVSNLDIFPTFADLAGVDVSDLAIEGESLVPQLFYAKDARDRVVFSETNYPDPLRAAITDQYKLIYNLKANVYELFDLKADPVEKKNLWGHGNKDAEQQMKGYLDEWLDRVFYSRDKLSQAQQVRSQNLLPGPPKPQHAVSGFIGGDAIEVVGWDLAKPSYKLGETMQVTVYFKSAKVTNTAYKLEVSAVGLPPAGAKPEVKVVPGMVSQEKVPADGTFPTSRWRAGEYVKETFSIRLPPNWNPGAVKLGVRLMDDKRQPAQWVGATLNVDGKQAWIGDLPVDLTPAAPAPTPVPAPTPLKP